MIKSGNKPSRWKGLIIWGLLATLYSLALYDFYQAFILVGNPSTFISKRLIIFLCTLPFQALFWGYWLWANLSDHLPRTLANKILDTLKKVGPILRWSLAGVLLILPAYLLLYSPVGDYQAGYWFRLTLLAVFAGCAAFILFPQKPDLPWLVRFSIIVMVAGVIFTTIDWLNDVTDYPFSLTWSEGNRFWDYSMLFGSSRYINPTGKPIFTFIESGRQFLWALPFLFPGLTLFTFRLWNALVWILPPAILGVCLVAGKSYKKNWVWMLGFVLWAYLFLSQGPIYSPLLLGAALVVIAMRLKKTWLAMLLIAFASYYMRISRFTWMYSPGLWAGMIALLEEDQPAFSASSWKKLVRPVLLGVSGYLGAEFLYPLISSISGGAGQTASSLVSDQFSILGVQSLLWDRLLPNPTYPPGIILGTVWVGLPAMLWIFWTWRSKIWKPNWMQATAVIGLCAAFMGLGFLTSVKIGGGSNLHNLDMLWVTLAILAGWIWRKWMASGFVVARQNLSALLAVTCIAVAFPATTLIQYGEPLRLPPTQQVQAALTTIQDKVAEAQKTGDVLFMDQRQLITFGYIKDLPMIAEYEKKYLMEQAMAGNEPYLKGFQTSLERKDYSLIVTFPISDKFADEGLKNFAEENNAWVEWVAKPLLTYYKPLATMDAFGIQLLVPRK